MADDVAGVDEAAGLFYFVGVDVEDFAFVGELGGDEAGFFCVGWGFFDGGLGLKRGFRGLGRFFNGLLYLGGHEAKVSSCI